MLLGFDVGVSKVSWRRRLGRRGQRLGCTRSPRRLGCLHLSGKLMQSCCFVPAVGWEFAVALSERALNDRIKGIVFGPVCLYLSSTSRRGGGKSPSPVHQLQEAQIDGTPSKTSELPLQRSFQEQQPRTRTPLRHLHLVTCASCSRLTGECFSSFDP